MRAVVYTCVFGDFDRVFAPRVPEAGIDYVLITDRADLAVPGWRTQLADPSAFGSPRAANRHFKFFAHEVFAEAEMSLYLDGNIRPIGPMSALFQRLSDSPHDMLLPAHPRRTRVAEEVEQAIRLNLVADPQKIRDEYAALVADGFVDAGGLTENNVILRKHAAPALAPAMRLWWHYVTRYSGRDQISFGHVAAKTGLDVGRLDLAVRAPNPYLHLYPHQGRVGGRFRALRVLDITLKARSPEGPHFRLAQRALGLVLKLLKRLH